MGICGNIDNCPNVTNPTQAGESDGGLKELAPVQIGLITIMTDL